MNTRIQFLYRLLIILFIGIYSNSIGAQNHVKKPSEGNWENITAKTRFLLSKDSFFPAQRLREKGWKSINGHFSLQTRPKTQFVWMQVNIAADKFSEKKTWLKISNKGINHIQLYKKTDSGWFSIGFAGDRYPFSQRNNSSRFFTFQIPESISLTDSFLLMIDKRNENLNIQLHLVSEKYLQSMENRANFYTGLFSGILLLAFVSTIFLFYLFRDKMQIWYAIYIISVLNNIITYEGIDFEYLYPNHPFYANISRYLGSISTLVLMMIVMQLYCKQSSENSKFYRILNINKWISISLFPITIIIYRYYPDVWIKPIHFWAFIISQITGLLLIMFSCLEKIFQRYRPAYFYFAAVVLLLINGVQATFFELGIINGSADTPNFLQWSFILEVCLISVGILYRYHLINLENEKLNNELHEVKINSVKKVLDARQQEQQRIAEDLHDLFGGHLAAIKLKISQWLDKNPARDPILNALDELSEETREIAHNLTPIPLHHHDISDIVEGMVHQLNREQSIQFKFFQTGTPRPFSKEIEIDLYKIILEIIHNILKHSKAKEADIQFFFHESSFEIIAEDNGVGIGTNITQGMGLKNIRNRVSRMKGLFHSDSTKNHTTIIIQLPI